ncbi:MAG: TRAP transporter fused permease subunit, partial [Clostridia bacterium]|nr:TRAP transporter fused permease subunit [Clostridia bacterium]
IIDATRRSMGNALVVVVLVFIAFGFTGKYLPGFLHHPGLTFKNFINITYITNDGIFGQAIYTSSLYIVLFITLGAIMEVSGVGDYITDLATSLFGRFRGGPAKVSVVASGFFGSISGSAVANVIGTGTFTIPLMKKTGYDPETAAAVEASASTGGQFTPPIMGATAFLIAERLSIPYFDLVKAAAIPAILYYISILLAVDLYAQKNGLSGIKKEECPKFKPMLKRVYLLLPMVFLVYILAVLGKSVARAGIYTILVTLIVVMFDKQCRLTPKKLLKICVSAAKSSVPVAVACAMAGVISGIVMGTGIGFRLSSILIDAANGSAIILLLLTMFVSLIMGMGIPTISAYIVLAILVAPALTKMGFSGIASHLFIFYFGCISVITPPVALASYAAAGLAKCNPNRAGVRAFRLAICAFILPFLFMYNDALLWQGAWYEVLWAFASAVVGVYCLAAGQEGMFVNWKIKPWERAILIVGALALVIPQVLTDFIGLGILVATYVFHKLILKEPPYVAEKREAVSYREDQ